jgi:molybdate-binding protein
MKPKKRVRKAHAKLAAKMLNECDPFGSVLCSMFDPWAKLKHLDFSKLTDENVYFLVNHEWLHWVLLNQQKYR